MLHCLDKVIIMDIIIMIFFIRVQISGNKDTEFFKILLENLPHMNSPNKKTENCNTTEAPFECLHIN